MGTAGPAATASQAASRFRRFHDGRREEGVTRPGAGAQAWPWSLSPPGSSDGASGVTYLFPRSHLAADAPLLPPGFPGPGATPSLRDVGSAPFTPTNNALEPVLTTCSPPPRAPALLRPPPFPGCRCLCPAAGVVAWATGSNQPCAWPVAGSLIFPWLVFPRSKCRPQRQPGRAGVDSRPREGRASMPLLLR